MNIRLRLYGACAEHEVELPTTDLGNWSFVLEKSLFGLNRDYSIQMTVRNDCEGQMGRHR